MQWRLALDGRGIADGRRGAAMMEATGVLMRHYQPKLDFMGGKCRSYRTVETKGDRTKFITAMARNFVNAMAYMCNSRLEATQSVRW